MRDQRVHVSAVRAFLRAGALVIGTIVVLAAPASAGGPYGSTSTTEPPDPPTVSCSLSVADGRPGDLVSGSIAGVAESSGTIAVYLGGAVVDETDADASGDATFSFTVPDLEPKRYLVMAVGADFNVTCDVAGRDDGTFGVLGVAAEQEEAGGGTTGGSATGGDAVGATSDGIGSLAFTGQNLLLIAIIGTGAVIVGLYLRRRGRLTPRGGGA